ncbi:MAG: M23 family metallopeptidase [Firmicutes bacterium]|jgi:biotin carboxyl carrier protein|nr:M23 family metallopeptidase [Bacillota bacterium]HPU00412.1 M23 family metallopeptidase [Bacillota bacterium]
MAWRKEEWTRLVGKGKLLLRKSMRVLSLLAVPLKWAGEKYRRWPRLLQLGLIYLLVVILSGGIYLWRSAQLRTINPYIEDKFNFEELDDEEIPGSSEEETAEQEAPPEPASGEPEAAAPPPPEKTTEPSRVWPVESRELEFGYKEIYKHAPYMDISSHHGFHYAIGIKALPGEKVHSISGGTVKAILDPCLPHGKTVVIEHEENLKVYYGALDHIYVKEGQQLSSGDVVATVRQNPDGETYLFLRVRKYKENRWAFIDPKEILPKP